MPFSLGALQPHLELGEPSRGGVSRRGVTAPRHRLHSKD
jgi:hypothetical protein